MMTVSREILMHPDFMTNLADELCAMLEALIDAEFDKGDDTDFDFIDECADVINSIRCGDFSAVMPVISRKDFIEKVSGTSKGIIKKVGYLCIIAVAIVFDYIIKYVATDAGLDLDIKAFFGLMVAVWYLLNELLSITENAGRMGAEIPEWLLKYIAVLKNKIASEGDE